MNNPITKTRSLHPSRDMMRLLLCPHFQSVLHDNEMPSIQGHNATNHVDEIDAFLMAAGLMGHAEDANDLYGFLEAA